VLPPDQDHEVREDLEGVEAPRVAPSRVDPRRLLVVLEIGLVPGTEEATARDALYWLEHVLRQVPRMDARRADDAVRTVDRVSGRLEAGLLRRRRPIGWRLLRVQNRCVVKLLEGVHVELPVRVHRGAVEP